MGQPKLVPQNDPVEVDGLEEIFIESETVALPSEEVRVTLPRGLTFKEACVHYGLKATALRVRIKSGEISAEKIEGMNGPEWRIYPTQPQRNPAVTQTLPDSAPPDTMLFQLLQDMRKQLDSANHQLQAATYRNGYLESQLETKELQIKLLTDGQHKQGWWRQFCSWFVSSPTE